MTASQDLVAWAWTLDAGTVPERVTAAVRRHMLDAFGCGLAAARLGAGQAATSVAATEGAGPCTMIGSPQRLSPRAAAFANGVLIHALDFDDTHAGALVHASAPVIPAALAIAELTGASGRDLIAAATVGYEIVCRVGAAVPHGFHARGFHATSICGTLAAAVVAARLLGLDEPTAVAALGIAGSFASGSLEFLADGSSTKQLHPGWAAQAGIAAAQLAAAGATGPASILEGRRGVFAAFTGRRVDGASLVAGLGEHWEVTRITLKPYPACQLVHASLDALGQVAARLLDTDMIESLEFAMPADSIAVVCEPIADKRRPRTPYDAKFSLPWTAAMMIADGAVSLDSFRPDAVAGNDVARLADRVTYQRVDFGGPAADAPGSVVVRLRDGTVERGEVACSRGGPGRPLSVDDVRKKLVSNAGDAEIARAVSAAVDDLAEAPNTAAVATALGRDATGGQGQW